ncbi:protein PIGBOS1 [Mastomys coucha]|uniref:protein PIGBOS1 n=1 Tax=Mastomys coucha TaxID=35658 RepID=UPI0012617154|nr:protein PIGBOS1 [Mastomys coucha]XP_031198913.1 protein PIGBOS1 [Mastomys coucha]XP_031198914.1 protein PIGBOS1 [Mastomys coucha]XP_031198915.1 protein PIGBOS1 [Mastomys coucha]
MKYSHTQLVCCPPLPPSTAATTTAAMLGRLPLPQLLFAAILGFAGGIYIYQPIFEQYSRDQKELKEKVKLLQESEEKGS